MLLIGSILLAIIPWVVSYKAQVNYELKNFVTTEICPVRCKVNVSFFYAMKGEESDARNHKIDDSGPKEICPPKWEIFGNTSCYYFNTEKMTYSQAETFCTEKNSRLASINDLGEGQAISDYLNENVDHRHDLPRNSAGIKFGRMWVGLKRINGKMVWQDRTAKFGQREQDWHINGSFPMIHVDCGEYLTNGAYISVENCNKKWHSICEIPRTKAPTIFVPLPTTTTRAPTTTTPKPTPCECTPDGLDIIFVVDSSGSVKRRNFNKAKRFVNSLIDIFSAQKGELRVGLITFNTIICSTIKLSKFANMPIEDVKNAITAVPYSSGSTQLGMALNYVLNNMLGEKNGDRMGVPNYIVILTDGKADDNPGKPARKLRKSGAIVLPVAIGKHIKFGRQLKQVVGNGNYLTVESFDDLDESYKDILKRQCEKKCPNITDAVIKQEILDANVKVQHHSGIMQFTQFGSAVVELVENRMVSPPKPQLFEIHRYPNDEDLQFKLKIDFPAEQNLFREAENNVVQVADAFNFIQKDVYKFDDRSALCLGFYDCDPTDSRKSFTIRSKVRIGCVDEECKNKANLTIRAHNIECTLAHNFLARKECHMKKGNSNIYNFFDV